MSQLIFRVNWLGDADTSRDELDATLAAIEIVIDKTTVSAHVDARGKHHQKLHIPTYYIAEWMAENWWQLLYEPRKVEADNRPEFLARHSMINAQHGFALPSVHVVPMGESISVFSSKRQAPLAGVRFPHSASASIDTDKLSKTLKDFVVLCLDRISEAKIHGTPLEKAWRRIERTLPDEELFCKLVGAIGADPYNVDSGMAEGIEWLHNKLGPRAARDLCLAATEEDFAEHLNHVKRLEEILLSAEPSDLKPISAIALPADQQNAPSWRRGVQAAKAIRGRFSFNTSDATVADKFFQYVKFSVRQNQTEPARSGHSFASLPIKNRASVSSGISGLLERHEDTFNLVLSPTHEDQRRFAAARGIFMAWTSESSNRRLVTGALTRTQQASRAFAAELLVPADYIKSEARNGALELGAIEEIARTRRASQEVVRLQAYNNNVRVITQ